MFFDDIKQNRPEFLLENFSGPLDLLLDLIREAKIDIKDIFVSQVTSQFLQRIAEMKELDLEECSEFLTVAATLIEIKSNSILPREEDADIPIEETPHERFISMLQEYKVYKEASMELKQQENIRRFFRKRDERVNDSRISFVDFTLENLIDAFSKVFLKYEKNKTAEESKSISLDPYTVDEKIEFLKNLLLQEDEISFFELFENDYNRFEVITTFQALLEILKDQFATATQKDPFGDITIKLKHIS